MEISEKLLENKDDDSWDLDINISETGKDFLFLFDLLSHTAGIESTLRVLTHADDTFRQICLPKLKLSEDHVKAEKINTENSLEQVTCPLNFKEKLVFGQFFNLKTSLIYRSLY